VIDPVPPTDRFITLGTLRFHYLDWGPSTGPPILFLHGAGLTAHTWDITCLELRAAYRCLALDLRGHGDTSWDPAGDYGFDALGDDISAFLNSIEAKDAFLVGHSLGGLAAIDYAATSGSRLSGLVLVDTVLRASGQSKSIRDFMTAPPELDAVENFVDRALQFNPKRNRRLLRLSLQQNLRQLPNGKFTWKYDRVGLFARDAAESERFRESAAVWIRTLQCPMLLVRGADSELVTADDAATMAAAAPNGAWCQVANAGHTVQGDNPMGFVEAVRGFLAGATRA
jgi:pimeloyl-ACP methyl ester carboxylesterase